MKYLGMTAITVLLCLPLAAQEPEGGQGMEEMMAAWMKYAVPGDHHARLQPLAGKFVVKTKFRMAAEQPWQESVARVEGNWVLGDRFLMQKVHSEPDEMLPSGFEGLGFFGYDNYQQKYVLVWMDTMSTMALTAHGEADGGRIAFKGEYADPMSGSTKVFKWVYELDGESVSQHMYDQGGDGEMFVSGELTYERQQ